MILRDAESVMLAGFAAYATLTRHRGGRTRRMRHGRTADHHGQALAQGATTTQGSRRSDRSLLKRPATRRTDASHQRTRAGNQVPAKASQWLQETGIFPTRRHPAPPQAHRRPCNRARPVRRPSTAPDLQHQGTATGTNTNIPDGLPEAAAASHLDRPLEPHHWKLILHYASKRGSR